MADTGIVFGHLSKVCPRILRQMPLSLTAQQKIDIFLG
jgi:hypothetical protein